MNHGSRILSPKQLVPVIILGGFCNWSVRGAVLGFWGEAVYDFINTLLECDL